MKNPPTTCIAKKKKNREYMDIYEYILLIMNIYNYQLYNLVLLTSSNISLKKRII